MKTFLTATAIFEGTTGLLLLAIPSVFISFMLGASLNEPGEVLARLAGGALLSISIICWSFRSDIQNISGIVKSLLFYNIVAGSVLIYAYIAGFTGLGLLPAALLHFVLGIWCIQLLIKKPQRSTP